MVDMDDLVQKRQRALDVRAQWSIGIASGSKSVLEAIADASDDRPYIRKLRLLSILKNKEGWTDTTAKNALISSGFPLNATIASLSRSKRSIDEFESLLEGSFQRWVPNVQVPKGYPFFGKIDEIMEQIDVSEFMPSLDDIEESGVSEEMDDDATDNDPQSSMLDELSDLLGDDDD